MKNAVRSIILILIIGLTQAASAERYKVTDGTDVLKTGQFKADLGISRNIFSNGSTATSLDIALYYGFFNKMQAGIIMPYSRGYSAFRDFRLQYKYFIEERMNYGIAFGAEYKMANGDVSKGLGTGFADAKIKAIYTYSTPPYVFDYNASYCFVGVPQGASSEDYFELSGAVRYPFSDLSNISAEIIWFKDSFVLGLGGTYNYAYGITFDIAYRLGMTRTVPSTITAGLTKTI